MNGTHEVLQKVDVQSARARILGAPAAAGQPASLEAPPAARLEYDKIRVWLRNPADARKRLQTAMVVACRSGAGGTTTAALLATSLAEARSFRVLVVESNWRTPRLAQVLRARDAAAARVDGEIVDARIRPTDLPNLFLVAADSSNEAPVRPLDEEDVDDFLGRVTDHFGLVLFDGAPVLDFPDSLALAPKVDGIILVVASEKTGIEDAQRAKYDLERAGGNIVGVVLNRHTDYVPAFVRRCFGWN